MATLSPFISAVGTYPYSWGDAETYSYVPIVNDANRPLFAKVVYDVANAQSLGQNGFVFVDTAALLTNGPFNTLQVVTSTARLSTISTSSLATPGNITNYDLPQGFTLNGPINSFSIKNGAVIAYKS